MYSKKITSTNTNITVEKIDTTETQTKNTNITEYLCDLNI